MNLRDLFLDMVEVLVQFVLFLLLLPIASLVLVPAAGPARRP